LKVTPHLHASEAVTLHLPFAIGDYTDFCVGIHHATAIGKLFRPDNPLLPNYKHVPIGHHGRAVRAGFRHAHHAAVGPAQGARRRRPACAVPPAGP
jgi:hypothetical protein